MTLSNKMVSLLLGGSYFNSQTDDLLEGRIKNILQLFDHMIPPESKHPQSILHTVKAVLFSMIFWLCFFFEEKDVLNTKIGKR